MEEFGSRSNSLMTSQISAPAIPSKELSDVIVSAFNSAFTQINNTQNNTVSGNLTGGLADTSIAEYYKNLLRQSLEKEEKQKKDEAENRKKKEEEMRNKQTAIYEKNAQTVLNEMSKWASNPLQGVSDLIDNGFKKVFSGISAAWNKPIAEIGPDLKKFGSNILKPVTVFSEVGAAIKGFGEVVSDKKEDLEDIDMNDLIEGSDGDGKTLAEAADSKKNVSKSEKDAAKQAMAETNKQNQENSKKQIQATQGVGLTIGGLFTQYILPIALAVAGLAVFIPIAFAHVGDFFEKLINFTGPELKNKLDETAGNIGIDINKKIKEILPQIKILGMPIYNAGNDADLKTFKLSDANQKQYDANKLKLLQVSQELQDLMFNKKGSLSSGEYNKEYDRLVNERKRLHREQNRLRSTGREGTLTPEEWAEQEKNKIHQQSQVNLASAYADIARKTPHLYGLAKERAGEKLDPEVKALFDEKVGHIKQFESANTGFQKKIIQGKNVERAGATMINNVQTNIYRGGTTSAVSFLPY